MKPAPSPAAPTAFFATGGVPDAVQLALTRAKAMAKGPVKLRFAYGEIPATVVVADAGDRRRVSFRAIVGHMPYSVEDSARRAALMPQVRDMAIASGGHIHLAPDQSIVVSGETQFTGPPTALKVMSAIVEMLVELRPVFEALGDVIPEIADALPARENA